ncbi:MAG: hypothetical protein ABI333_00655 [bacterium]
MSRTKLKRNRMPKGRKAKNKSLSAVTIGLPGTPYPTMIQEVRLEDREALEAYFAAHSLLPFSYIYDPHDPWYFETVTEAIAILRNTKSGYRDRVAAIVVLGHSPEGRAIKTLRELGNSRHPMSALARMALNECLSLVPSMGHDNVTEQVN